MHKNIRTFKNDIFNLAVKLDNGEWVFDAERVAKCLGITESKNGKEYVMWRRVNQYLKPIGTNAEKNSSLQLLEIKKGDFIPEPAVYKLAFKASNEVAEKFQDWLAIDVLPQLRQTGACILNNADPDELRKKANELESLHDVNKSVELLSPMLDAVGINSNIKLLVAKNLFSKAGIEIPVDIKAEEKFYDTKQIAKEAGIYSTSGKPHYQVVNIILNKLELTEEEQEKTWESSGSWQGTVIKYTYSVVEKVKNWLIENNYPSKITVESNGKARNFTVTYKEVA